MKETKKANKATANATGITTVNKPEPRPLMDLWDLEENDENKSIPFGSALDAGPADMGTGAPASIPEDAPSNPFFWQGISDDDVKAAIHGCFLETICNSLAKNYRGTPPFPMILGHALILMASALTHQGEEPEFLVDSNGATERVWLKTTGQSDAERASHGTGTGLLIGSFWCSDR